MKIGATLTIKCDHCAKEHVFLIDYKTYDAKKDDTDGWLLSEIQDLCPPCLEKRNEVEQL